MSHSLPKLQTLTPTALHAARTFPVSHASPFLLLQIRSNHYRQHR